MGFLWREGLSPHQRLPVDDEDGDLYRLCLQVRSACGAAGGAGGVDTDSDDGMFWIEMGDFVKVRLRLPVLFATAFAGVFVLPGCECLHMNNPLAPFDFAHEN